MPDIWMCATTTCPKRKTCRRCPESGTVPNGERQSWFITPPYSINDPLSCDYYMHTTPKESPNADPS